ncbi:MAG: lysophospholipid acyltransferase family protein [Proteobacteria bacterium]|nr:lysophospholipid acyltransferase family protein [Pseudomonadota bacterium]
MRWTKIGFEIPSSYIHQNKSFIVCFWHGRLMMMPYAWAHAQKRPFHMLISGHRDGKLISKVISYCGIKTIEGSSTHEGSVALKQMVRILKNKGTVGITPDGPKGPCYKVKMGIVMASYLTQSDILPATFSVSSSKILRSWDRFLWAFPSKKGILIWGEPISAPKNKDPETFEKVRLCVENELLRLKNFADKSMENSS